MKRLLLTSAAILFAAIAAHSADIVTHYLTLDTATQTRPFATTITRGSTPLVQVSLLNNGRAETNLAGYGAYIYYAETATTASGVYIYSSATATNYFQFQFNSTNSLGLNTNAAAYPSNYWAQVVITNAAGRVFDWSQGKITIRSGGAVQGAALATVWASGTAVTSVQSASTNTQTGAVNLSGQITSDDIRNGTIASEDLGELSVSSGKIAGGAVVAGKVAGSAIVSTNVSASGDLRVTNASFYVQGLHQQSWGKPAADNTIPVYSNGAIIWASLSSFGGGDMLRSAYATGSASRVDRAWQADYAAGLRYLTTALPLTNAGSAGQVLARDAAGLYWVDQASGGIGDMTKAVYDTNDDGRVNSADTTFGIWTNKLDNPNTNTVGNIMAIAADRHIEWKSLGDLGGGDMMSNYWTESGKFKLTLFPTITAAYIGSGEITHDKISSSMPIGASKLSNDVLKSGTTFGGDVSGTYGSITVDGIQNATAPSITPADHMKVLAYQTNSGAWMFVPSGFANTNLETIYATGTPLYVETYQGTITGGTIAASDSNAVWGVGADLIITWDTNAAEGGTSGGGAPKTLGGAAQNWSIMSAQATNVSYATQEGVDYLNFATLYNDAYVDTRRLLASNVTFAALYLYARAWGSTGAVDVVVRGGGSEGATNTLHMTTNLTTYIIPLSGGTVTNLALTTFDWGVVSNNLVTDFRAQAATIQGTWQ